MSVMSGRGDEGMTDLLFGKRIAKTDVRVEALGAIDELNAALGMARCQGDERLNEELDWVQDKLVGLMGELAVIAEDRERYANSGMPILAMTDVQLLEEKGHAIEASGVSFKGWARPGAAGRPAAASLDVARTVCRRAERRVLHLEESPKEVRLFLNRLADWLWLVARREEQ